MSKHQTPTGGTVGVQRNSSNSDSTPPTTDRAHRAGLTPREQARLEGVPESQLVHYPDTNNRDELNRNFEEHALKPAGKAPGRRITLIPASNVRTERLDWLIDSWVPRRSLTLLAGREGLGKSTIACKWAADATTGELTGTPMNVAYLHTEDSRSHTVKPRLEAAGADLGRVFFIDVTTEKGNSGALQLPGDTPILARTLADSGIGLVILDAAKSAMHSSLDGYRDDDVRQFLEPLAAMCDRHDMSVIGLVHFGKRESNDPGKLILGSVAWSQIARSVLSVAANDEGTLVVTNTKGNLAPSQVSREARLESVTIPTDDGRTTDVGRVVWGDQTDVSAADLLVSHDDQDDDRTDAEIWLGDYLGQHGPTRRKKVIDDARKAGFTVAKTVQRAFKKLGGVSGYTSTVPREAEWSIPNLPFGGTRDTGDKMTPRANTGVPTVPTGDDQRKQNVPTGGESQQGHGGMYGVPTVPTAPELTVRREATRPPADTTAATLLTQTHDDAVRRQVLGTLDPEHPQTIRAVSTGVEPQYRNAVEECLGDLLTEGTVNLDDRGRYTLTEGTQR